MSRLPIAVAWTGASGSAYGLRLVECLLKADEQVYLMVSKPALLVLNEECEPPLPGRRAEMRRALLSRFGARDEQLQVYGQDEWTAPVASGSALLRAMVVCPCSMATLSAIAVGSSRSLIERAADVVLKEQRKLILVPRETPFSAIHLENMLALARMGTVILPANPGFYHRPTRIEDLVDFVVARVLDQLGVANDLATRWGRSSVG
ncbi:MAG: flavin prenyltransferase UbiX [Pseudomonadota bacterium]|nr:flavin prenyltransferase UbiX [Pseudomonadota bacterium]